MSRNLPFVFAVVFGFLILGFVLSVMYGPVYISLGDILKVFFNPESDSVNSKIIWQLRIPRTLSALLAGAALSVSGLLMQTFFRNPIAGPDILGISSGAGLGAAIWIMGAGMFVGISDYFNDWGLIIAASTGAFMVLLVLLFVSGFIREINSLLIIGLMLGSAGSALVMLLQFFTGREELQQFVIWSMGDLAGISWSEIYILFPVVFATLCLSFLVSQNLNVILIGETNAKVLGVSVRMVQGQIIILTALMAGSITAFCGPISFIGVAVPHLSRLVFRTNRHQILIFGSALLGMTILIYCQLFSQIIIPDKVLPINIITSVLGAPAVVWILLTLRR
jgi:iron complex transport system permease protein